ncbi:hypothetical protein LY76DRAFT_38049 [Colletotrichum caudatum]|nr:hypothetical protein LY76DRAFT_38049 [Colletotrichum caudatum]
MHGHIGIAVLNWIILLLKTLLFCEIFGHRPGPRWEYQMVIVTVRVLCVHVRPSSPQQPTS